MSPQLRSAPRRLSPPGEFRFSSLHFCPEFPFFSPKIGPVPPQSSTPRRGPNGTFQRGGAEL